MRFYVWNDFFSMNFCRKALFEVLLATEEIHYFLLQYSQGL